MNFSNYTKEFRYNLKLAYPVILGMVGHTMVGLIDDIMVGKIGTTELAAVSLGNSFLFIAMSLGIGFSTAITPLVAEADGEGNKDRVKAAFKHGLFLCTVLALGLFTSVLIAKPLMYHMKQPDAVVELAMPYLNIVAASLIPLIIFQAFKQFSDGLSQTKYAMWATLIANGINVLLNYLLIYGKLGFPKLGITGAAIGTLVSRIIMVLFIWWLLRSKEKFRMYVTNLNMLSIQKSVIKKIVNLGFPSSMQMLFEVAIFTAAIWLSGVLGQNAQAANQIALKLSSLTFMVGMGLSVAAMIRVGNQKGMKNFVELRRIAFSVFALTLFIEIIFAGIFIAGYKVFPDLFVNYNNEADLLNTYDVVKTAGVLILIAAFFQISDGVQVVVLGALRGLQDVMMPMLFTFIAYWVVGFPISYYLGLHTEYKSAGIWLGLLAGLTVSAILLFLRFNYLTKKLIAQKESN
ncbi:MATE family efflux transporter [Pseudofulvibacter geojedonensis]|uniref:Multidrug-efflux transporter n=1 Tax=Pseudofulvibacter geojedonensis TaxID=1123758 RepID=A0ABW3HYM3_9FLAO